MASQDIVSYFKEQWIAANTSGTTPDIGYDIEYDDEEDPDNPALVPGNYNRGVFFKNKSDLIDEIGMGRTHQDETSEDMYECECVDFSKPKCKELVDEVRRITRLQLNDDEHSWLDADIGKWSGPKQRKSCILGVMFSRAGIAF